MLVIGHRGASHDFTENTVAAFRGAAEHGADWVELDVRRTADGALVVHHDPHLADGTVIAATERAALPAEVPLLADALDACAPMGVNVEIKNSPHEVGYDPTGALVDAVIGVLADFVDLRLLVSCFDLDTLGRVRASAPSLGTGYLVLDPTQPIDAIGAAIHGGHRAINPWDGCVTEEVVLAAQGAGVEVNVWTVDDPDRIRQLYSWGVDAVITNRPRVAREAIGRG